MVGLAWWIACSGIGRPLGTPEKVPQEEAERPSTNGPVQAEAPNASGQRPAFSGQTRAPQPPRRTQWTQTVIASGLEHPWALEVLPDGRYLVTERAGRLRIVAVDGTVGEPIAGLPLVFAGGQGGLLDVALAPDFAESRRIFWSYAEPRGEQNGTAVATALLAADERSVLSVQVIFRQQPSWDSALHFGSRLAFAPDGLLFVTLGERSHQESRVLSQDLATHLGKIVRIRPDGSVPEGNPFVGKTGLRPEIWSYGHRNLQAAAIGPDGHLWTVEHGPRGGDELNRPDPGKNYGWPVITYGQDYSGRAIGEGITARAGMEQPVYYWDPVIAPSGMTAYSGKLFADWKDNLLVGGLRAGAVVRLVLNGQRVQYEEWIQVGARVRDVKEAPDGAVLALTDEDNGRILRLTPGG